MQHILVIGATGMIGKPVTEALLQSGLQVSLMVRNKSKAQPLFPTATLVEGDVFDPLSLLNAFSGIDSLYISLGPNRKAGPHHRLTEREGIDNILSVAKEAGIKRIAFLSSLVQNYNHTNGFHWWVFDVKQQAVEKVKTSGIPWTIFYPSSFFENFDRLLLKGKRMLLATGSKAPMYFIGAQDYGKQVTNAFRQLSTENKEYVIQGTTPYTWDEGAKVFIAHYKKARIKITKVPLGIMKFMGKFIPFINNGAKILEALNNYPEKFEAAITWKELGKPATSLEEYAASL